MHKVKYLNYLTGIVNRYQKEKCDILICKQLKWKVEAGQMLTDEELMKFIILPLSYKTKEEKEEKVRKVVEMAIQIQDKGQQIFVLSGILAFTDKIIDQKTANEIRKMIEMTQAARLFEEEKQQALSQAARVYEEEKQQALSQAARVYEEEKQQALKEERENTSREIVINMLKRNFPSNEIVSVVSGYSQDDVEALRKAIRIL